MANGTPNGSTLDQATRVIRDLGFPIVIAAFLLWKLPPKMDAWTEAVHDNATATSHLAETISKAMDEARENRANIAALRQATDQNTILLKQALAGGTVP